MKKRFVLLLLTLIMFSCIVFLATLPAAAATAPTKMWVEPSSENGIPVRIDVFKAKSGSIYQLYMPGNADLANCFLSWDGEAQVSVDGISYDSGDCPVPPVNAEMTYAFKDGNNTLASYKLITYQGSQYVQAVFIEIDESDGKPTIAQMDSDPDHEVTCSGEIYINGTHYDMPKIKGRGNFTWSQAEDKRPYNVTLDSKIKFPGIDSAKTKKWSFLAEVLDHSLLSNRSGFYLAHEMGVGQDTTSADVWMNGEYQGCYTVTPKTDSFVTKNGYMVEQDNHKEPSVSSGGDPQFTLTGLQEGNGINRITVKKIGDNLLIDEAGEVDETAANLEAVALNTIKPWLQDAWDAMRSNSGYNSKGKYYTDYIDIESFAKMYLMQEYVKDLDVCAGSIFFYREGQTDADKLFAGPLWDLDLAMGSTIQNSSLGRADDRTNGDRRSGAGFFLSLLSDTRTSIYKTLGKHDDFMQEVYRQYSLNRAAFDGLESAIDQMSSEIEASARMNHIKVNEIRTNSFKYNVNTTLGSGQYQQNYLATTDSKSDWGNYVANMKTYVRTRSLWFKNNYYDPIYSFKLSGWTWADDYSTATATFTNADGEEQTVDADIVVESTEPTFFEAGERRYTATAVFGNASYSDTQIVVLPATGAGSGTCGKEGDNLTWKLYNNGKLVISGDGYMADFSANEAPWSSKRDSIKAVVIDIGVSSIGENAFDGCENLATVYYGGTSSQWDDIIIAKTGNEELLNAKKYFLEVFEGNGVRIEVAPGALESEVVFVAEQVENAAAPQGAVVYELHFEDSDGNQVQPDGEVTVSITVPDGMDGTQCKVYFIDKSGALADMQAELSGENLTFTTDHFSLYAVIEGSITVINYSIKFNANGGTGTMTGLSKCVTGETYTIPANKFKRTGYTFTGWNTAADGSGTSYAPEGEIANATYTPDDVVTLYAQWQPYSYTVIFYGNGATSGATDSIVVSYDESRPLPANQFVKDGYDFKNWSTKANGSGTKYNDCATVKNLSTADGGEVVLYAQWEAKKYSIVYDGNGEDVTGATKAQTGLANGKTYTLSANKFTKEGYHFAGWNTKPNGDGDSYKDKAKVIDLDVEGGEVVLYAQWEQNTYTVTYNGNGGKYIPEGSTKAATTYTQQLTYDEVEALLANEFTREGYSFVGWNLKKNGTGDSYTDGATGEHNLTVKNKGKVTLYAIWEAHNYTIEFDANEAAGVTPVEGSMEPLTIDYGVSKVLTANSFTRAGYTFAGWNTEEDGSGTKYANKAKIKNLTTEDEAEFTLYAQWTMNTYSVKFNMNKGTAPDKTTFAQQSGLSVDNPLKIPNAEPTRKGYVFTGWNTKADGTGDHYEYEPDAGEVQLYAQKNKQTFTLYAEWEAE